MRESVLGIDAAWTATQPSGVALVAETCTGWQLVRVSSAYGAFSVPGSPVSDNTMDAAALLATAQDLTGRPVTLVAADLPLSREPIIGRRVSDNMVSVAYGARHAATHSPGLVRPGPISDRFRDAFAGRGYDLRTDRDVAGGLIEVYPHPALINLCRAPRRLPYKVGRIRSYWPDLSASDRTGQLLEVWRQSSACWKPGSPALPRHSRFLPIPAHASPSRPSRTGSTR